MMWLGVGASMTRTFTMKKTTHSPTPLELALSTSRSFLQVPIIFSNGCIIQQWTVLNIQRVLTWPGSNCLRSHLIWQVTPTNDYLHWVTWDKLSKSPWSFFDRAFAKRSSEVWTIWFCCGWGGAEFLGFGVKGLIVLKVNHVGLLLEFKTRFMFGKPPCGVP